MQCQSCLDSINRLLRRSRWKILAFAVPRRSHRSARHSRPGVLLSKLKLTKCFHRGLQLSVEIDWIWIGLRSEDVHTRLGFVWKAQWHAWPSGIWSCNVNLNFLEPSNLSIFHFDYILKSNQVFQVRFNDGGTYENLLELISNMLICIFKLGWEHSKLFNVSTFWSGFLMLWSLAVRVRLIQILYPF